MEDAGFKNTGEVGEDAMEIDVTLLRSSSKVVWVNGLPEKLLTLLVLISPVVVSVIVLDITRVDVSVLSALMYIV